MGIWVVGTLIQIFIKSSYTETKFSKKESSQQKNFVLYDRFILYTPFYLSEHQQLTAQICMKMCLQSQYFQVKSTSGFKIKVLVFQKTCFKVKVLITLRISSNCHIKICQSLKRKAILKIPGIVFQMSLFSLKPL